MYAYIYIRIQNRICIYIYIYIYIYTYIHNKKIRLMYLLQIQNIFRTLYKNLKIIKKISKIKIITSIFY